MAKPEIRAVKKNSNKNKEPSQKQEIKSNSSASKPEVAEETPSSSEGLKKPNESPSQKTATPNESSSEPASPSNNQSPSSETLQKPDASVSKPAVAEESSSSSEKEQQKASAEANQETTTRFFQAVGVIEGEVSFDEQGQAKVTVSGQTYPLLYIPKQKYKLLALQKRIRETGNPVKRLIVYPRAIHFPDKNKPQQIQFQLLKFEETTEEPRFGISQNLANMEFQLAGLWQFIPVCRVPCISVFKNFSQERMEWIKKANVKDRVKFMKPAHLPVLWKQAPVKPFKYNPKAEEQEKPAFVKIKAKFLPSKDAFGFDSLLEAPTTEEVPKYLKVSKKDKQQAQQEPAQSNGSKQNGSQSDKEQKPDKQQNPEEKASTGKAFTQENSFEDTINRIAQRIENREELAQHKQGEQASAIAQQLISQGVKDEDYSLPSTYVSNWKHGRNVPKETSKHYPAYRLWQLVIGK